MRLNKLKFENKICKPLGLKPVDLSIKSLGSIVALTGKNGAGKSRFLNLISKSIQNITKEHISEDFFSCLPKNLQNTEGNIKSNNKTLYFLNKNLKNKSLSDDVRLQMEEKSIYLEKEQLLLRTKICEDLKNCINDYIIIIDNDELKEVKTTIDKTKNASDLFINSKFPDLSFINSDETLKHITDLSAELVIDEFNLRFDNRTINEFDSFKKFKALSDNLEKLLGKKLHYKTKKATVNQPIHVDVYLDENIFKLELLSPGEKTLFAYALILYYNSINQNSELKECIIVLDEPEKHLHPEAQILLINALSELTSESGQLFIATHSISILAQIDPSSIYLMSNGEISTPSRFIPALAINQLFNLEEHIETLKEFMFSISDWSFSHFITQCLGFPDVISDNNPNDPQVKLFIRALKKRKAYSILDFGCGEGRIPRSVFEGTQNKKLSIQFDAFEPNTDFHLQLEIQPNIQDVYADLTDLPKNKYDLCILSNVLHEIEPSKWVATFNVIRDCLKENGSVLILEDKFLSRGEKAHEFGYIILFEEELSILFKSESLGFIKSTQKEYSERLLACLVPYKDLKVTADSINKSIAHLSENTFKMANEMPPERNILNGRRKGHLIQLYFNAQSFLKARKE